MSNTANLTLCTSRPAYRKIGFLTEFLSIFIVDQNKLFFEIREILYVSPENITNFYHSIDHLSNLVFGFGYRLTYPYWLSYNGVGHINEVSLLYVEPG